MEVYRHGAGVNTHTGSVCTLEWLDVFMGISTQASTGGTAHSEEAWLAASSLIQAMPFVLILSLWPKTASMSHHKAGVESS